MAGILKKAKQEVAGETAPTTPPPQAPQDQTVKYLESIRNIPGPVVHRVLGFNQDGYLLLVKYDIGNNIIGKEYLDDVAFDQLKPIIAGMEKARQGA